MDTSFGGISSIGSTTEQKEEQISIAERIRQQQRQSQQTTDRQDQNQTQNVSGRQTQRVQNIGVDQTGQTPQQSSTTPTAQRYTSTTNSNTNW